ncbi:alpha/beta hydrolase [Desulfovibrio sp. OttesenSCG-928-M14]|nr:alpha/beta hydrolase [Desulfovibrio sp. OttesenSCG-928-M14]
MEKYVLNAPHENLELGGIKQSVILEAYCSPVSPELGRRWRGAVIICPGGAYAMLADREAGCVALRYQAFGYQAFVLRYSVGNVRYPVALLELATAVAFVRERAELFDVDPNRISVCGFSAGGHLCANLGVAWNSPEISSRFADTELIRPNSMILCYPVITAGLGTHAESMCNLLGPKPDQNVLQRVSLERHVSSDTPPAFLWHTNDDALVSVNNSLLFASALSRHGISFELHIFPDGGHGLSLADDVSAAAVEQINPRCAQWFGLSLQWLEGLA